MVKASSQLKIPKCYVLNGENGNSLGAGRGGVRGHCSPVCLPYYYYVK